MQLPRLAIQNHQFTTVLIILLVMSGVVSFITMPRSEDPQVSPPGTTVIVVYPGATPEDVEELIVDPLEEAINELEDIKEMTSSAGDGLALVAVEFRPGNDPDEKYTEVVEKVNSIRASLPQDIASIDAQKWSVNLVSILQVAIVSEDATYRQMEKELERLEKKIHKAPGVRTVETWAFPEQQVRVAVDLEKAAEYHIPFDQVAGAIQSSSANIPGGSIDIGARKFNIQTSGSYKSIEDIRNTVIRSVEGRILYLKDIADVDLGYGDHSYTARYDGRRAVFLTVTQKLGTNIFRVMDRLKAELDEFGAELPRGMELEIVFDQSRSVASRLNGFFLNLLQGLALVGLIVFLSVNVRSSIIVMLAIPLSILIGIGFVDLTGYGLQQMSIAGLVIALGLLVDNAIVVTENVSRFMRLGHDPRQAAIRGTSQIGWAVVSSTATTVLAFVPIMMMRDVTGDFIRSMPATVVYTLLASLLMSLTLTPYLASRFIRADHAIRQGRVRNMLNRFVETRYRGALDYALSHPKRTIALTLAVFMGSLALFPVVGVSYFPKAEKTQFIINVDSPEGTSISRTDALAREVESILREYREVKHIATNLGHGNPRLYYNMFPKREASNHAQIYVELADGNMKRMQVLVSDLRRRFAGYPGAKIEVREFEQGPPVEAPIAIRILGDNLETLKGVARDVEAVIAAAPGTVNIVNPLGTSRIDLHVDINRAKAGLVGVNLVDIDRTVRAAIAGHPVARYRDPDGKEYDIVARLPVGNDPHLRDFDRIFVTSVTGAQVPLKQVAEIEFRAAPMTIEHFNLERSVTITADVERWSSVDRATRDIRSRLDGYNWPRGYKYYIAGELESREESFGGMSRAVVIALIAIMAVLVLQFKSYTQPLIVFAAIPLAIVGSILALLITRNTFSFTAFIGITSLVGIVINNSIILVDYTNQLRREGKDLVAALKEAGETRFIPIVLTTATTVAGLLPLTLSGGTMWAPMGWAIIGGLVVSTGLTLIVVPVLFEFFTRRKTAIPPPRRP
ncbi:MAG: efflux RND transporter permease subunit [bacterium]|jgi:multidrug efflux pump subunit AcrB